jgi:excisionase family DNA binding protein
MQDLRTKEVFTTGEVARICHVAPRTVSKWIDTGKLSGYRIPGSRDRRVPAESLVSFMREYGLPLDALDGGACRVLLVSGRNDPALIEAMQQTERYEVRTAGNGFEAGVLAQQYRPQVMVLEIEGGGEDASAVCRNIRSNNEMDTIRMIAAVPGCDEAAREKWAQQGFDAVISCPPGFSELAAAIEQVTDLMRH